MRTQLYTVAICAMIAAAAAQAQDVEGYLYTSLNGEGTNQVVAFERLSDGTLGKQTAYTTGALGGANRAAGGDAAGDFDAQGAIQMIGDNLLVVNAGGNSISVFAIDRATGALTLKQNVPSGGARPVSIAYAAKRAGGGDYWVVVGNQWNNPNVQKGGFDEAPIEMYPNAAFHADGGGHEDILDDRNIYLFSFDAVSGTLTPEHALEAFVGTNGGPTTVAFNDDGSKLAVSTWGIAHFATGNPTHQQASRVYVYDFDARTGDLANARHFEEEGVAGSIGFSWAPNASLLYVSNFNLAREKIDHSLTVLADDGAAVSKVAHFGTGDGDDIDEACWTIVSPDGRELYVSSFGGNLISEFDIDASGMPSKVGMGAATAYTSRKDGTPAGDNKDMYISADGEHMYVMGAYQTFTLTTYDISESGGLNLSTEVKVDAAVESGPGAYNFLGLVGFDK